MASTVLVIVSILCLLIPTGAEVVLQPTSNSEPESITGVSYGGAQVQVSLWPQPQSIVWKGGSHIVLHSQFVISTPQHPELRSAAKRYTNLIKKERWLPMAMQTSAEFTASQNQFYECKDTLVSLEVTVLNLKADLQHGVDESFKILVEASPARASLTAHTAWGAMRGLETFSQLVHRVDQDLKSPLIIDSAVTITDYPLYPHRGLLIDLSRAFFPVCDLKRTIRALSYNKLNVLHLHITDAPSFPLEIKSEPELARKGSYGPAYTYSHANIQGLVRYARYYGVRVIPEVDIPGHSASWGAAYPEIVTCLNEFWLPNGDWAKRLAAEPGTGQLNPLIPKTYEVVKNVIDEVATLFTDKLYHAGGDEISPACWMRDALVQEYVAAPEGKTLSDLMTKFVNTTRAYVDKHNKTVVYWEDIILDSEVNVSASQLPPATTILQTWNKGPINTKTLTAAGYRTIVSSSDFYYLDCGHGGFLGNDSRYDQDFNDDITNPFNYGGTGGSYCAPFKTWARIYDYDIAANLTSEEAALVIGGEVALWSEQADSTVLDGILWPRTAALAEALWSGNRESKNSTVKRYSTAINRLNDWRFHLLQRGIRAEPLQPLWCLRNPGMCNFSI